MKTHKTLHRLLLAPVLCAAVFTTLEIAGADEDAESSALGYTARDIRDKLVVISHEWGSGNGFIANMDGKVFLFTNQHILLGAEKIRFTTLSGETLRPRRVELSAGRDIARLLLSDDAEGFEITEDITMDTPVGVFGKGNSGPAPAELYGKVTGVGADVVEVSAEFLAENSGSPVLNARREALGIASYVRESVPHAMKEGTRFEDSTRRFCYRLTGDRWQPVNWRKYNQRFGRLYRENNLYLSGIFDLFEQWEEEFTTKLRMPDGGEAEVTDWVRSHNALIGKYGSAGGDRRAFAAEFSSSLRELAGSCSRRSQKIRAYLKPRGLNRYLRNELEGQAALLDSISGTLDTISKRARDLR